MTHPLHEFLVYAWPQGGWVITADEQFLPVVFDSRIQAEMQARRLATRYGVAIKGAAPAHALTYTGVESSTARR